MLYRDVATVNYIRTASVLFPSVRICYDVFSAPYEAFVVFCA